MLSSFPYRYESLNPTTFKDDLSLQLLAFGIVTICTLEHQENVREWEKAPHTAAETAKPIGLLDIGGRDGPPRPAPWYECMLNPLNIELLAKGLNRTADNVASDIATKLMPPNWEVFFWMSAYLERVDQTIEERRRVFEAYEELSRLRPVAEKALPFIENSRGRGPAPITKAIDKILKVDPSTKTPEVWRLLKEKNLRGYVFCENRLGQYIEDAKSGQDVMKYRRFQNLVAERRKKLRNSGTNSKK